MSPRYIYIDSLFYDDFQRDCELRGTVESYLHRNELVIMVTDAVLMEKRPATSQHSSIYDLWKTTNAALIEPVRARFLYESAVRYPVVPSIRVLGRFSDFLDDGAWLWNSALSELLRGGFEGVRSKTAHPNFAAEFPDVDVPASMTQVWEFTDRFIAAHLRRRFGDRITEPQLHRLTPPLERAAFSPLRVFAGLVFLKHYVDTTRRAKKGDFGDQLHSFYFPLCNEVVLENDQAAQVRQLQHRCPEMFYPWSPSIYNRREFLDRIRVK